MTRNCVMFNGALCADFEVAVLEPADVLIQRYHLQTPLTLPNMINSNVNNMDFSINKFHHIAPFDAGCVKVKCSELRLSFDEKHSVFPVNTSIFRHPLAPDEL